MKASSRLLCAINGKAGPASIDYKASKEFGLRIIAVGGNSLSHEVLRSRASARAIFTATLRCTTRCFKWGVGSDIDLAMAPLQSLDDRRRGHVVQPHNARDGRAQARIQANAG